MMTDRTNNEFSNGTSDLSYFKGDAGAFLIQPVGKLVHTLLEVVVNNVWNIPNK